MTTQTPISVNALAAPHVDALVADAERLRVGVAKTSDGVTVVDAGIDMPGGIEAGLRIAEICMGGLGSVRLAGGNGDWPSWLEVRSSMPVAACLASQYAGWSLAALKEEAGGKKFFALGSGPARALAVKEDLYRELAYRDRCDRGVLVLEVDRPPPPVVLQKVLHDCGLKPEGLTIVLTPTRSLAGMTQVVARVLEVALHKAHQQHFPLADIVDGFATAPLPCPVADGVQAMGRSNDAILYGGRVHLSVRGDPAAAHKLALELPSSRSPDYGKPFAEIFKAVEYDFYKIDGALFAPAEAWVSHLESGRTFRGGRADLRMLQDQWLEAGA